MTKKSIMALMLASTRMTPMERAQGRFLRAPDGHPEGGTGDAEFDEFAGTGNIEMSDAVAAKAAEEETAPKPRRAPKTKAAPEPAPEASAEGDADEDAEDEGEGQEGEEDAEDEGEEKPKKTRKASERFKAQSQRIRQLERTIDTMAGTLQTLQNGGLQPQQNQGTQPDIGEAPDPTDTEKYPLGHLDERYVEDKLEYLATKKATEQADAVLQRQQETERNNQVREAQEALLGRVEDMASRGADLYDDFQETVVEAGLKGAYPLGQSTFESAYEATHGAQILYELSQDVKEATRVANLTDYQQMKYVMERDAAITAKLAPRHKPGAGEPPKSAPRGANSRVHIDPATDNLDDFERAWEAEAKKNR